MIEAKIIDFLKNTAGITNVFAELPEDVPDEFVILTLMERSTKNFITTATFNLYSYAEGKVRAIQLDASVRASMRLFEGMSDISSCKQTNGADVPDVWLNKYRYSSTYNIVYYDD